MLAPLLFLLAADATASHLGAVRTPVAPVIDGVLDDDAWKAAAATSEFTQQIPFDGRPPSEKTTLRVMYDDQAIYFGFDCQQAHSPIVGRLTRRDHDSESEWVWIQIDSRRDGKNAVQLAVNVAGVLADGAIHDQTVYAWEWDENWEAKTNVHAGGWSAEIRVPLRILRYDSSLPVQSWGLQAARFISQPQETDIWAYTPRDIAGGVARYGSLDDLHDLKRGGGRFELRPFVSGRERRLTPTADTLARGYHFDPSLGVDLKWHVTQDLTMDAAVLPDFAQVETDQLILNLTNTETFLPEKRPLFLEGADAFATPLQVFYSRRIGSAPASPTLHTDTLMNPTETLLEVPNAATVYGAAKLVGRLNEKWSVGALGAVTGRNNVTVQDKVTGTQTTTRPAQPAMAFSVLRLKRELGRNAYLGLIATSANPIAEPTGEYPDDTITPGNKVCPSGVSVLAGSRCFHHAFLAGLDGYWRSEGGDYVAGGQLVGTLLKGGAPLELRDGTTIRSGDRAPGGWMHVAKEGGKLVWSAEYAGNGRKLEYNDLGYLPRQNLHDLKASVGYRTFEPGRFTVETTSSLVVESRWNLDGLDLGQLVELNTRWRLRSFWSADAAVNFMPAHFDDREIGDGVALERARWVGGRLDVFSDPRRAVAASISNQTQLIAGAVASNTQVSLIVHPHPQLEIEFLPQLTYTTGEPRYAFLDTDGKYAVGRLLAKSVGATLRAGFTFTPELTLQTYMQMFLASGHYTDLVPVSADSDRRIHIAAFDAARGTGVMAGTNPDFQQAALNVNVVLRWEYRLGSTLFLVYSRTQIPTVDMPSAPPRLNPYALAHGGTVDMILLKASFWWAS